MRRVLTVGLTYTGHQIPGVEIENLGLCQPRVNKDKAAYSLSDYDVIIINPESYSHFLFGMRGKFSGSATELYDLKKQNQLYDLDSAFDFWERNKELSTAIASGATVIWCLSEPNGQMFFGARKTHIGYLSLELGIFLKNSGLLVKKSRRMGTVKANIEFTRYFSTLSKSGWELCLTEPDEGFTSFASTPEGHSLGGHITLGAFTGWLLTPPTSPEAANQLILDAIDLIPSAATTHEEYQSIFLSHTNVDKPFVRKLREDLLSRGVPKVWLDEAQIEIGDSLTAKIAEGMKLSRYIAVVLSTRSINAPWVKKELELAVNREISTGQTVILPLLFEKCELPEFLRDKLYADFSDPAGYNAMLDKLLRRLRIA